MERISQMPLGFELVEPGENSTLDIFYLQNKTLYKDNNDVACEGKVVFMTEEIDEKGNSNISENKNVELTAFVTKDGIVIFEDWDVANTIIMDDNPNTEFLFFPEGSKEGYPIWLDDDISWMRTPAPGATLPEKFNTTMDDELDKELTEKVHELKTKFVLK